VEGPHRVSHRGGCRHGVPEVRSLTGWRPQTALSRA
jgi:hypothetical protein